MIAYARLTRCTILVATLAMATATFLPAVAQTSGSEQYQSPTKEGLKATAAALNAQRGEALKRKDAAAIADMYTADATFVELLPRLQVMRGRAAIRQHFEELTGAQVSNVTFTIASAEMNGRDSMSVGGDYVLATKNDKMVNGHFFQVLRQDGGTWKIAMESFARPEPVTAIEESDFRGN